MAKSVAKITIDATDAIKTLKAIQREAREATKALRELEYASNKKKESKPKWIWREETKEAIESINNVPEDVELKTLNNGSYMYEEKQKPTHFCDELDDVGK